MKKIPLLLDKPVTNSNEDQFGHEHYADLLFELITNDKITPPYNVGLLGKWGVGKSSIKEMCQKRLKEEKEKAIEGAKKYSWDKIANEWEVHFK